MNFKDYFTKEVVKKLAYTIVMEVLLPMAEEYVKKTDNKYDDAAVQFLKDFSISVLEEEENKNV